MKIIVDDKRTIEAIYYSDEHVGCHKVEQNGVTKIEAYPEKGQQAFVPWFAIYQGDFLYCRVNAAFIDTVVYDEESND